MSKRERERRERREPGVHWLSPTPLVPGSKLMVVGVTKDAPRPLLGWWERESRRRGIDTTERKAA